MNYNRVFIFLSIGFVFGIFFGNIFQSFNNIFIFVLFICFLSLGFVYFLKRYHKYFFVCIIALFLGLIYSGFYNLKISKNIYEISKFYNKNYNFSLEIKDIYSVNENYKVYNSKVNNTNLNFLLYVTPNYNFQVGNILNIDGKILEITNFNEIFDYKNYLLSQNIYFKVYNPNIISVQSDTNNSILKQIYQFKVYFIGKINSIFPQKESALLSGILLGDKTGFSKEQLTNYNNSGLTHLVAVSGTNISIIILFFLFIFKFLPNFLKLIFIPFFVVLFILLVGLNPSVIRAGITGILGFYLMISGRKTDFLAVILFAMLVMLLYNPLYLNFDTSFILSFLAVFGIFYTKDFFGKIFNFLPRFFAIKESFILTMSSMSTTLPIMLFGFGKLTLVSPITNMLLGGVLPFAMFFGFLSIIFDYFSKTFGYYIGYFTYFILRFVNLVADFFGNISFLIFNFDFKNYGVYFEILYFIVLMFLILYFKQEKKPV